MDRTAFTALVERAVDVSYRGKQLTRGHAQAIVAAVLREQAEHFERQADQAPDGQSRTLRLFVADQVRPPA